jgi:hypothetical protein
MMKLAALAVLGAWCAIGFPCLAVAADVVDIQCRPTHEGFSIILSQASAGVKVPPSCSFGSPTCTQCQADLLSQGFLMRQPGTGDADFVWFTFTKER